MAVDADEDTVAPVVLADAASPALGALVRRFGGWGGWSLPFSLKRRPTTLLHHVASRGDVAALRELLAVEDLRLHVLRPHPTTNHPPFFSVVEAAPTCSLHALVEIFDTLLAVPGATPEVKNDALKSFVAHAAGHLSPPFVRHALAHIAPPLHGVAGCGGLEGLLNGRLATKPAERLAFLELLDLFVKLGVLEGWRVRVGEAMGYAERLVNLVVDAGEVSTQAEEDVRAVLDKVVAADKQVITEALLEAAQPCAAAMRILRNYRVVGHAAPVHAPSDSLASLSGCEGGGVAALTCQRSRA
jgi:hypothetical protein